MNIKLGVIFGGVSVEHEVSVISAVQAMQAIDKEKYDSMGDFELVDELSKIGNVKVPNAIEEIRSAKVLHDTVCEVDEMESTVKKFLGM